MEEVKETVEVTEEVVEEKEVETAEEVTEEIVEGIGSDEDDTEYEVQTTFNEDPIEVLVEEGEVENVEV